MAKQYYLFKLIPPRSTFTQDLCDKKRQLMDEYGHYFQK